MLYRTQYDYTTDYSMNKISKYDANNIQQRVKTEQLYIFWHSHMVCKLRTKLSSFTNEIFYSPPAL